MLNLPVVSSIKIAKLRLKRGKGGGLVTCLCAYIYVHIHRFRFTHTPSGKFWKIVSRARELPF